jgi:peroxiredoxin
MSKSLIPDRSLGDRVAAFQADLVKQAPDAARVFDEEIQALVRGRIGSGAPHVGDRAPTFTLPDARGGEVALERLLRDGPVALVFYRGQWCPYCDLALRAYQEVLPQIRALRATLVAVSPQVPDESLSTAEKRGLAFPVLSDHGNGVARRYGLVFMVSEALDRLHRTFGIDLARSNGDASNELPVPGVFVVARDQRIGFAYVEADYRQRLEPAELLRQLERVA